MEFDDPFKSQTSRIIFHTEIKTVIKRADDEERTIIKSFNSVEEKLGYKVVVDTKDKHCLTSLYINSDTDLFFHYCLTKTEEDFMQMQLDQQIKTQNEFADRTDFP